MDTPDFFVGARLGGARIKAGISLEKAAKDTRIRVQRLREIEADDFSGFTHPTYSRLFLLDYAEYLGLSRDEVRPLLPDRAGSAGGGFQYINALSRDPSSPVVPMPYKRPNLLRIFVAAVVGLILVVGGLSVYSMIKKIERLPRLSPATGKSSTEQPAAPPDPAGGMLSGSPAEPVAVESGLPAAAVPVSTPADGRETPVSSPAPFAN
ncbi:MAG: helix-turn-helix domain-containing protein [Verrucomicrobiota bacterium]